jgi:hypothetical protein
MQSTLLGGYFDFVNKLPVLGIGGGKSESKNQQFWLFPTPSKNIWVYERTTDGSLGGYLNAFKKLTTTAICVHIYIYGFRTGYLILRTVFMNPKNALPPITGWDSGSSCVCAFEIGCLR